MKKMDNQGNYESYRWFFTSGDLLVVGGKNDSQNELVIKNFLKPNYIIMHSSLPGSPFCIIVGDTPDKKDIEETAIFCACFSQQWKSGKKLVDIDIFKGDQIYKKKSMKTGTFGVKGNKKTIKVKPELVLAMQKGKLRAVPKTTKEEKLVFIGQGNLSKENAITKISEIIKDKYHFPVSRDEISQAIPADKLEVRKI